MLTGLPNWPTWIQPKKLNSRLFVFASVKLEVYILKKNWLQNTRYCDMTPENGNRPLLDNDSLKYVSPITDTLVEIEALPRN
jgi:hypothetical protein